MIKNALFVVVLLIITALSLSGQELNDEPFSRRLPIPELLEPLEREGSNVTYELTVSQGKRFFLRNRATPTLGYNGDYLGPTLRVRRGEEVTVRVINTLNEETTLHWHGLHVPGEMDGGPRQVINAGEKWTPRFDIVQPAATLWYHPHLMGRTGEQVYRGLAGLFIIEDKVSDALPLPKRYGVDDIPLILQDRRFHEDGSFAYMLGMPELMHGVIGNVGLVNGVHKPFVNVPAGVVRFRLLNGSNSSIYQLRLSDDSIFFQIASDGGFLRKPAALRTLVLSPGERAEILVDFSVQAIGESLFLQAEVYGGGGFDLLKFAVGEKGDSLSSLPERLTEIERIPEEQAARIRIFRMQTMGRGGMMGSGRLTINGKKMDLERIDERVRLGDTEIWEIVNERVGMMAIPHSFHPHDIQFQILSRNGEPPAENESGWKDTVLLWPGDRVRIIASFTDFTGIYMYHCHLLEHEDDGMMGQFEVFGL